MPKKSNPDQVVTIRLTVVQVATMVQVLDDAIKIAANAVSKMTPALRAQQEITITNSRALLKVFRDAIRPPPD